MDVHALPEDHGLKPLENRLLAMCDDTHPAARVLMGNAVAALRDFCTLHPDGFRCNCWQHCELCGRGLGYDEEDREWDIHMGDETVAICPNCKVSA